MKHRVNPYDLLSKKILCFQDSHMAWIKMSQDTKGKYFKRWVHEGEIARNVIKRGLKYWTTVWGSLAREEVYSVGKEL